jgi:hypothetical protein
MGNMGWIGLCRKLERRPIIEKVGKAKLEWKFAQKVFIFKWRRMIWMWIGREEVELGLTETDLWNRGCQLNE